MKRATPFLALVLTLAYLCVALASVGCVGASHHDAADVHHGAQAHPATYSLHGLMCSWSCQVNTLADVGSAVASVGPLPVAESVRPVVPVALSVDTPQLARSRAPPPFVFVS